MEIEASKQTVCPSCNETIMPGDTIVPYAGVWIHSTCTFPRFGTSGVSAHAASVQQRNERIRKYAGRYPEFSIRDLAEHLGYSKSTVARVLQEQARERRTRAFANLRSR